MGPLHSILTAVPQATLLTPRTSDIGRESSLLWGQFLASTQMSPGGRVSKLSLLCPLPSSLAPQHQHQLELPTGAHDTCSLMARQSHR